MKKSIYLILCAVALLFSSCGKSQDLKPINIQPIIIEDGDITYKVDPRAELMMIACRLAEVRAFKDDNSSDYVKTIDKMFEKQKDHPLVKDINKRMKKFYGNADYELKIVDFISEDMTSFIVSKKEMPAYLNEFWKGENFDKFIKNFNDFAVKGNFEKVWKLYELHLKGELSKVKDFYNKKPEILQFYKDYFYGDEKVRFEISSTKILGNWVIPMPVYTENGQKVVKIYQSPYGDPANDYDDIYIHLQYVNGVCFNLIHENWDKISGKTKALVDEICKQNKISTKKFKDSAYKFNLADVLCAAINSEYIYANKEPEFAEEVDKAYKKYILYQNMEKIDALFADYKNNRQKYPNFEVFFTEYLINVLNNEF